MSAALPALAALTFAGSAAAFGITANTIASQQGITLDDGTFIQASPQSAVEVEFSAEKRLVRFREGEAVFKVAEDGKRPFTVNTGMFDVTVVGGRGSFALTIDVGVTVTATDGPILVSAHGGVGYGEFLLVYSGETQRVSDGDLVEPVFSKFKDRVYIELKGRTIGEAVATYNRHNGMQIAIEDQTIVSRSLLGHYIMPADRPRCFARAMAKINDLVLTQDRSNDATRVISHDVLDRSGLAEFDPPEC